MRMLVISAAIAAPFLLAGQALAVDVTNRDETVYMVTVAEGNDNAVVDLYSGETIEELCEKACRIDMENGETISLKGDEVVEIQAGKFVVTGAVKRN